MATFNTTGVMGFYNNSGTAISAWTRVSLTTGGVLTAAGATGGSIGVLQYDSAAGDYATVLLPTFPGTRKFIATTLISAFTAVFPYAAGLVGPTGASGGPTQIGFANAVASGAPVAATSLGSILEVLPLEGYSAI